jgi:hypothetical protein
MRQRLTWMVVIGLGAVLTAAAVFFALIQS